MRLANLVLSISCPLWFFPLLLAVPSRAQELRSAALDHPVVAAQVQDRRLRRAPEAQRELAEQVLAFDAATLRGFFQTDNGLHQGFPCPECGNRLEFDFSHPEALVCQGCNAVVNEERYPPTDAFEGTGPLGDPVVLAYSGVGNDRRFVGPLMRNLRHLKLAEAARALGEQYLATEDEAMAERAVAILLHFAEVFPHWPVMEVQAFPRPAKFFINPPRPHTHWVHYKWRHTHNYDIPEDLTFAYDFVYHSPAWDQHPGGRERVENDLLRAGYEKAWGTHEDMGRAVNNLTGTLLASTILLGRVLNEPDMIHRSVDTLKDMLRTFYHFDGMEYEGTLTYHGTVTGRCGIAERMLAGYRDPEWYTPPEGKRRFTGMSLQQEVPIFRRAWQVWNLMRFPNGNPICIHDTNFPAGRRPIEPDAEAVNIELNAYGHIALGRGRGLEAVQAHLRFPPFSWQSHYHHDKLGIILFGAGEEVLSDIGYVQVGRRHRYFANSSIAHNTVTIEYEGRVPARPERIRPDQSVVGTIERVRVANLANRDTQDARSTLLAYDPGNRSGKTVQLVAASVPDAPHLEIDLRTRELLLVALGPERSCLIDIFRVQGGVRHHFALRPSCDEDVSTENCSLEFGPERPGTLAGEAYDYTQTPPAEHQRIPYSWLVHSLRPAPAEQNWTLDWLGADSGARLRLFMAGLPEAQLLLGQSPSLRRARNNDHYADDFQNPHLVLQRPETGAGNTFAAVYETVPQGGESLIRDVEFTLGDGATANAPVTVRIHTADGQTIELAAAVQPVPGAAALRPSYRMIARRGGELAWTWSQGEPTFRLPLVRVLRLEDEDDCNGFVLDGTLAEDALAPGDWIRVLYGDGQAYGYGVESITRENGQTLVAITGEPGFAYEDESLRLLFHPFYETPGPCWVEAAPARFVAAP